MSFSEGISASVEFVNDKFRASIVEKRGLGSPDLKQFIEGLGYEAVINESPACLKGSRGPDLDEPSELHGRQAAVGFVTPCRRDSIHFLFDCSAIYSAWIPCTTPPLRM